MEIDGATSILTWNRYRDRTAGECGLRDARGIYAVQAGAHSRRGRIGGVRRPPVYGDTDGTESDCEGKSGEAGCWELIRALRVGHGRRRSCCLAMCMLYLIRGTLFVFAIALMFAYLLVPFAGHHRPPSFMEDAHSGAGAHVPAGARALLRSSRCSSGSAWVSRRLNWPYRCAIRISRSR